MKRIIKVQVTRTFTKTATIELPLPPNCQLDEVTDYLYDTQSDWDEIVEKELQKTPLESDPELDNSRFDVYEQVLLQKQVYGGTL